MLVEDGQSGGITVAPRMQYFMAELFALERSRAGEEGRDA
jgi:hypothetical protein